MIDFDQVFLLINLSVLPAWLLMVILPNSSITKTVVHSYLYPVLLGGSYLFMLIYSWGGDGGMDTLQNLKISFGRDEILILGWLHYLVFDLFNGAWIARDSKAHSIHHLAVIPSLILTLFAGPVGLLSYLGIRWIKIRKSLF